MGAGVSSGNARPKSAAAVDTSRYSGPVTRSDDNGGSRTLFLATPLHETVRQVRTAVVKGLCALLEGRRCRSNRDWWGYRRWDARIEEPNTDLPKLRWIVQKTMASGGLVLLEVSARGFRVLRPNTEDPLFDFPFPQIHSWGNVPNKFSFRFYDSK
eukprot:1183302-Prorocentrum_minimum.AAC.4